MEKQISLGLMEQPIMRKQSISEQEEAEIREVFNRVTHVEGKYLATLELLKERVNALGGEKPLILHAQYPPHGDADMLNLGNTAFPDQFGDRFSQILDMFEPEWISFHLGFSCEKLLSRGQFDFAIAESEVLPEEVLRQRMLDNIAFVRKTYLKRGEILLENLDYNPRDKSGAYEHVCDPDFIDGLLTASKCGMLLDIGHANCSGQNMSYDDVMAFIFKLPLEKVVEVHMSGAGAKDGLAHDSHHPINKEGQPEVGYLEEILKSGRMTRLKAVTLETFEDIIPQLELLRNLLERSGYRIGAL
ncbi:DUF692 domain-containing protein [candidate division NPL-UPA2 bacterium]|nr:DUF692 domain-containing protein [candidate division NPL-UPA2 bacterium]